MRGNLVIILPFAVLLGGILGLGRLYHDNEITAAQAAGVGNRPLVMAAAVVALLATALAAWISFVDGPEAARKLVQIRTEALRTALSRGLTPGQFRALGSGVTLNFRSMDADGVLRDVFVERDLALAPDGRERLQVVLAARAQFKLASESDFYLIELTDGESHEGTPGSGDWRVTRFAQQTLLIPQPEASLPGRPRVDARTVSELRASTDPRFHAELHWRYAWVLINLVLGFIAVPLARLRPRQGRHARVVWAVLLFAMYAGLLSAGRTMLERGETPRLLGLWWVHVIGVLLAAGMLWLPRAGEALARRRAHLRSA
jgi:lipopolysaccharide export system permease protein